MKQIILPQPPEAARYRNDVPGFMTAASDWMRKAKVHIEEASRINDSPLGQQFVVSDFTTNTTITGTMTGTDLANAFASVVQAMTERGMISPTIKRGDA